MKKRRVVQFLVASAVSLTSVAIGVSSAWPTPVIAKFHDNSTGFRISDGEIGWMLAFSSPGFVAGSLATRFLADKFGRRATILMSALPIILGTIIVTRAVEAILLCLTRFLWGMGTGIISTVSSIYLAEVADKEIRGTLILISRFMFNFGNLLVMAIGSYVSYEVLNYLLLVLPLLYFVVCWWIPESPYFYLKEKKIDEARDALFKLRRYNYKELEEELQTMRADVQKDMTRASSAKEFFTGKRYRKALQVALGLKMICIMTGATTIQSYLGRIMLESQSNMRLSTVFIVFGAVKFLVGIMSSALVDRIDRRPLLIYSYLGTGISLLTVAAYFFCQEVLHVDHETLRIYGPVTFVGILASNVISTVGYQSTVSVVFGEIFPLNVRAVATTAVNILGGTTSFVISRGFQAVKDVLGLCGVFSIFGSVCLVGAIFSYLMMPETRGKSLMEIQRVLQGDLFEECRVNGDVEGSEVEGLKEFNVTNGDAKRV